MGWVFRDLPAAWSWACKYTVCANFVLGNIYLAFGLHQNLQHTLKVDNAASINGFFADTDRRSLADLNKNKK